MKRISMAVMTAAILMLHPVAGSAETGQELFQKALVKERAEGNFNEAVRLYQTVLQKFASDRTLAAKALLQMADCYEKLGLAESRKAYERLLREFSDQNEQAAVARTRLSTLGGNSASAGVTVRQVWADAPFLENNCVFPDGRRIAYINWDDNDSLYVRDLGTGETRKLTSRTDGDGAIFPAVSPDSKLIAYYWYLKKGSELRVIGADGSAPRSVYSNPEVDVEPAVWFPDGKHLVARFFRKDQTAQLAVISLADGKARVLKSGAWQQAPRNVSVSADGRHILYDFPPSNDAPERDIYLMAADGTSETVLVRHPAEDILLGWTPDGKHILFRSNRSGSMSIWALPMSGNRPGGEPRQLKSNVGNIEPLGFARNGAFYYSDSVGAGREVYIAELDPETGKGTSKVASTRHMGEKGLAVFSRDGKLLIYQSGPQRDGGGRRSASGITVRSLDSGKETDVATSMAYINALFHNGEEIRLVGRDQKGLNGLFGIDPRTGELKQREEEPGSTQRNGKLRFIQRQPEGLRTVERDLQTGQETTLVPEKSGTFRNQGARSSADWKWLVWRSIDRAAGEIRLMSSGASGGQPITLVAVKKPGDLSTLILTPDSKYALFSQGQNGDDEVWRVPIAGGQPVATGIKAKSIQSISVHPDGRRVAIGSFGATQDSVWVMENWQSELRASR